MNRWAAAADMEILSRLVHPSLQPINMHATAVVSILLSILLLQLLHWFVVSPAPPLPIREPPSSSSICTPGLPSSWPLRPARSARHAAERDSDVRAMVGVASGAIECSQFI